VPPGATISALHPAHMGEHRSSDSRTTDHQPVILTVNPSNDPYAAAYTYCRHTAKWVWLYWWCAILQAWTENPRAQPVDHPQLGMQLHTHLGEPP